MSDWSMNVGLCPPILLWTMFSLPTSPLDYVLKFRRRPCPRCHHRDRTMSSTSVEDCALYAIISFGPYPPILSWTTHHITTEIGQCPQKLSRTIHSPLDYVHRFSRGLCPPKHHRERTMSSESVEDRALYATTSFGRCPSKSSLP